MLTSRTGRCLCALLIAFSVAGASRAQTLAGQVEPVSASDALGAPQPYPGAVAAASGQTSAGAPYVWTRTVERPGATFLKLHFADFDLADGDYVTVSDPDGHQVDEYRGRGPAGRGSFWAFAVDGDRVVVSLSSFGAGGAGFQIDQLGVGTPVLAPTAVCGSDGREHVACYGAGPNFTAPVARLLFQNGGQFFFCTGFLVRGSNQSTLMTNEHCIADQAGVTSLEARFNYRAASCAGGPLAPFFNFFGGTFLTADAGLDYSLMTLLGDPEGAGAGEYVATRKNVSTNDRMALPQHSGGDVKQVAVFEGAGRSGGPCRVLGVGESLIGYTPGSQMRYSCDSEGGSSGSPVIGREQDLDVTGINHLEVVNCLIPGNYATHMDDICDDAGTLLDCS